jgi:PadR family transcriptional regulator, regulatory protein PadR
MADKPSDLVQGTLDMLILKTLALEPMHGYGIAVRLEQMSKGVFRLHAGSLFVAFQRLERDGLIKCEWKATENSRRAKYYVLTEDLDEEVNGFLEMAAEEKMKQGMSRKNALRAGILCGDQLAGFALRGPHAPEEFSFHRRRSAAGAICRGNQS